MIRVLKLGTGRLIAGASEIVIEIDQGEVATLSLEMMLLLRGFTDAICVTCGAAKLTLRIAEVTSAVTSFDGEATGRMGCSLSRDNAEYLESTLLRSYRDGMAEVSHVHIEGTRDGRSFDLTLLFGASRPPMSPEEAETLMSQ